MRALPFPALLLGAFLCSCAESPERCGSDEFSYEMPRSSHPDSLTVFGEHLYFRSRESSPASGGEWWRIGADMRPQRLGASEHGIHVDSYGAYVLGDALYTLDDRGFHRFDPETATLVAVTPLPDGHQPLAWVSGVHAGRLYYPALNTNTNVRELWRFDGQRTERFVVLEGDYPKVAFAELAGTLYFAVSGGGESDSIFRYREGEEVTRVWTASVWPHRIFVVDDFLYFSDGTEVRRVDPEDETAEPLLLWDEAGSEIHAWEGSAYLATAGGARKYRLEGTHFVPAEWSAFAHSWAVQFEGVWLGVGCGGGELAISSDGETVTRCIDIAAGEKESSPAEFSVVAGRLWFSASDTDQFDDRVSSREHGRELWSFKDGEATLAADLAPGNEKYCEEL